MAKQIDLGREVECIARALAEDSRFSDEERKKLLRFSEMVLDKNQYMNLTAITEGQAFYTKHILDSLTLLPVLDKYVKSISEAVGNAAGQSGQKKAQIQILDIGSGAGLPGMPLKIMRQDLSFTLLDSLQKRVLFLREMIEDLALEGIEAVHERAEDFGQDEKRRSQFSIVTARAVAPLPVLLELAIPCLKLGGVFLAMKALKDETRDAKKAMDVLGANLVEEFSFELPGDEGTRTILCYQKVKMTPKAYPRKAGTPNKKPLM